MSAAAQILQFIRTEISTAPGERVGPTSPLFSDGLLDSLNLVELIAFLETQFAIRIGASELVCENFDTVDHIAAFVARKQGRRLFPLP
jgi:acyl carrier protein